MEVALPNPVAHLKSLDPVRLSMDHLVDRKTDASVPKPNPSPKPNLILTHILNLNIRNPLVDFLKKIIDTHPLCPFLLSWTRGLSGGERQCQTWQDSLPAMSGIVSLTSSAPRPNSAGQGQSGCVSVFRKSLWWTF